MIQFMLQRWSSPVTYQDIGLGAATHVVGWLAPAVALALLVQKTGVEGVAATMPLIILSIVSSTYAWWAGQWVVRIRRSRRARRLVAGYPAPFTLGWYFDLVRGRSRALFWGRP